MRSFKHAGRAKRRGRWLAAAATVPLVVLPAVGIAPWAAAAEVDYFGPEPATVLTLALYAGGNDDDLRGVVCQSPRNCIAVPYPYLEESVSVKDLQKALKQDNPGQRHIVFGYSQGARVAANWLEEFAGTKGARSPDKLSFVLIGNPGRKHGGAHLTWGQVTPDTQYEVIDVARQYDLTADYPDHPQNLLALANAYAGLFLLHADYESVDLYDPANYVWKEGNTTYVFVPTEDLPLLQPLRTLGLTALADALNGPLKAMVEKGYDRSYLPAQPGWPAEPEPEHQEPQVDPAPAEAGPTSLTFARTVQTSAPRESTVHQEADPDPDIDSLDSDDEHEARFNAGEDGQPDSDSNPETDDVAADPAGGDAADDAAEGDAAEGDAAEGDAADTQGPATSSSSASPSESGNSSGGGE